MVGHGNANFTQGLLQSTFYSILEPEVATATEVCRIVLESSKDHVKAIKKVTPIYLLDKLELNVKSRCVFAWSGELSHGPFNCTYLYVLIMCVCC
jgi:hypothetical protein